jgi:hypothetical protein
MDFLGFRTNPAAAFLPFPNPRGNRSQGPGSARTHRLWKEKTFLVPVAGGRPGPLAQHDPTHFAALWIFRPAKEAESLLSCPVGLGGRAAALVYVKDILDKGTLGTKLWGRIGKKGFLVTSGRSSKEEHACVFSLEATSSTLLTAFAS